MFLVKFIAKQLILFDITVNEIAFLDSFLEFIVHI